MRVNGLRASLGSSALVQSMKNEIDNFESRVSTTESSLRELFEGLKSEVEKLSRRLDLVDFTLDNSDAATFGFLPRRKCGHGSQSGMDTG